MENLAKEKGFTSRAEYQKHLAHGKGFESHSAYLEHLTHEKGFTSTRKRRLCKSLREVISKVKDPESIFNDMESVKKITVLNN